MTPEIPPGIIIRDIDDPRWQQTYGQLWRTLRHSLHPLVGWSKCEMVIVEAVACLPAEVQTYVAAHVQFSWLGAGTLARLIPTETLTATWLITLSDKLTRRDGPATIAHEIAHVWLGHDHRRVNKLDAEVAAAELAKAWGFTGPAANPAYQRRLYAQRQQDHDY